MEKNYLSEAFKRLALLEDDFNLSADRNIKDELTSFVADDVDVIEEPIIDVEAETTDELQDNYIGKVILECDCCHTRIYKNSDDVIIDEETQLANVEEECPVCNTCSGYHVIGKIEGFEKEPDEVEETEVEVDGEEVEPEETEDDFTEEEIEEAFKSIGGKKRLTESDCDDINCEEDLDEELPEEVKKEVKMYLDSIKNNPEYTEDEIKDILSIDAFDGEDGWYTNGLLECDIPAIEDYVYSSDDEELISSREEKIAAYGRKLINQMFNESCELKEEKNSDKLRRYLMSQDESLNEDVNDLKSDLNNALRSRTNLLIEKRPGDGTLAKIKDWAKTNGINLVTFMPLTLDSLQDGVISDNGKTKLVPAPAIEDLEKPKTVVLIDEIHRVSPKDMNNVLSLLNDHKVGGKELPNILFGIAITYNLDGDDHPDNDLEDHLTAKRVQLDDSPKGTFSDKLKGYYEDESLNEDFKEVSVTTDDQHMEMSSDENGKVTVTTEPVDNMPEEDLGEISGEEIAPLTDEDKLDIEDNVPEEDAEELDVEAEETEASEGEEEPEEGEEDLDIEDFDEESFDELGESYMKKVYENVSSFKTTNVSDVDHKIMVEGIITFNSGNSRKTSFTFNEARYAKNGQVILEGSNNTFSNKNNAFIVRGNLTDKKFISESMIYNYTAKTLNESTNEVTKVYGRVKKKF